MNKIATREQTYSAFEKTVEQIEEFNKNHLQTAIDDWNSWNYNFIPTGQNLDYFSFKRLSIKDFCFTENKFEGEFQKFVKDPKDYGENNRSKRTARNVAKAQSEKQKLIDDFRKTKHHSLGLVRIDSLFPSKFEQQLAKLDLPEPHTWQPNFDGEKISKAAKELFSKIDALNALVSNVLLEDQHAIIRYRKSLGQSCTLDLDGDWKIDFSKTDHEKITFSQKYTDYDGEVDFVQMVLPVEFLSCPKEFDQQVNRVLEQKALAAETRATRLEKNQKEQNHLLEKKYPQTFKALQDNVKAKQLQTEQQKKQMLLKLQTKYQTS